MTLVEKHAGPVQQQTAEGQEVVVIPVITVYYLARHIRGRRETRVPGAITCVQSG